MKLHKKAQQQLDKLIEAFKDGRIGKVVKRTIIPPLDVPCARWSLCNRVIVALSDTDDARGYKQWQEAGRQVKHGSRALYIMVPCNPKKAKTEQDDEEKEDNSTSFKNRRFFIAAPIFRYQDTEGTALDRPVMEPPVMPPLYDVAKRFGCEVSYQGHISDVYGSFAPGSGNITLESQDNEVFWHELAHAAHQRVLGHSLKGGQHAKQEAVAELTATVIAGLYGSDWSGNCWRYLEDYSKDPLALCFSVLSDTSQVLTEILKGKE